MPSLPFTLRQLEVFESLCATRSFRRTAELMGISQASVSNQVKALEEQLGAALLDRKPGRRPTLRAEGIAFLDDLREFRKAAEALASHRRARAEERESLTRFKVLVGQGMFDAYVRRKLDSFLANNPQIDLEFETKLPFGQLIRAIETGGYDFALINQRSDHRLHPEFRQLAMVRGGVFGHRKFARGRALPLDLDLLNSLPFILPKTSSAQEREVMRNYEIHGIKPRNVIGHTPYFDVMAAMLDRGLGVASFSEAILPPAMRKDVIHLAPLQDWRLLYYRREPGDDPRCAIVEQFLVSSVLDDPDFPAIERNWQPPRIEASARGDPPRQVSRPPEPARSRDPAGSAAGRRARLARPR